jgi:DNA-binding MarR family transcriptional regulator
VAENEPARARAASKTAAKKRRPRLQALTATWRADTSADVDSVLHHRMRLGIVSALASVDTLTFVELRELLKTTDGNLSVHARKLEDAGLVSCTKSFTERRPRSDYRVTPEGLRALRRYLAHMEAVIEATRTALER